MAIYLIFSAEIKKYLLLTTVEIRGLILLLPYFPIRAATISQNEKKLIIGCVSSSVGRMEQGLSGEQRVVSKH